MSTQDHRHQPADLLAGRTQNESDTDDADDYISAAEQHHRLVVVVKGMLVLFCALVGWLGIQGIAPDRVATEATGLAALLESFTHTLLWSAIGAVIGILVGVLLARLAEVILGESG